MKAALAWARTMAVDKSTVADYLELTKPSVTSLILMSTLVGFFMAVHGTWNFVLLINTLIGTALVAASAASANHYLEIDSDAKMRRTEMRPLPAGRLHPSSALMFSLALAGAGTVYLLLAVNVLTCAVGALTWASYLFLYTPMKRRTTYCTFVGAFPGAFPILMGWTAARGTLDVGGWVLCAILFVWQFPHFYAIAWMYRDDYARGGIQMLPVSDTPGTIRQVLAYSAALIPVSLLPVVLGMAGVWYAAGALALGAYFFYSGVRLSQVGTAGQARLLLKASIVYLPLIYTLLMLDKRG
jgi:protoheme IX farnesyltransferase